MEFSFEFHWKKLINRFSLYFFLFRNSFISWNASTNHMHIHFRLNWEHKVWSSIWRILIEIKLCRKWNFQNNKIVFFSSSSIPPPRSSNPNITLCHLIIQICSVFRVTDIMLQCSKFLLHWFRSLKLICQWFRYVINGRFPNDWIDNGNRFVYFQYKSIYFVGQSKWTKYLMSLSDSFFFYSRQNQ